MIDPVVIGAVGGIVLILSWAYETFEAIKKHKSLIDLKFATMNIFGVLLLILYSWQIENAIFLYLNIILFSIELAEIAYSIAVKKVHKKKR
ncbi:MAG: hypothetical protein KKB25_02000 [Nanoarchaeota archaeon]|nr:hypothetical protein [Nanoarchaeota archaeon]